MFEKCWQSTCWKLVPHGCTCDLTWRQRSLLRRHRMILVTFWTLEKTEDIFARLEKGSAEIYEIYEFRSSGDLLTLRWVRSVIGSPRWDASPEAREAATKAAATSGEQKSKGRNSVKKIVSQRRTNGTIFVCLNRLSGGWRRSGWSKSLVSVWIAIFEWRWIHRFYQGFSTFICSSGACLLVGNSFATGSSCTCSTCYGCWQMHSSAEVCSGTASSGCLAQTQVRVWVHHVSKSVIFCFWSGLTTVTPSFTVRCCHIITSNHITFDVCILRDQFILVSALSGPRFGCCTRRDSVYARHFKRHQCLQKESSALFGSRAK